MLHWLLLLGCAGSPQDALGWRESWEVLVLTVDGGLIDGRASIGNTGLFRGQGHLRIDRWSAHESPILFGLDGGPADVDISDEHDAVRVGTGLVGRYELGDNWTFRVSSEQASAILHVDPGGPQPPMATALARDGQWTVTAPITLGAAHGWFTAGKRGGIVNGWAVTLHRGGDGRPEGSREAAFVLGPRVSIGLDTHGDARLAWARIDDRDFPLTDLRLHTSADGGGILDFRPSADLRIELRASKVRGERNGFDHLYAPEALVADIAGLKAQRIVRRATAIIHLEGDTFSNAAVLVTVQ